MLIFSLLDKNKKVNMLLNLLQNMVLSNKMIRSIHSTINRGNVNLSLALVPFY